MTETPPKAWFRPKRYGYGATPQTWQGWTLTLGSLVLFLLVIALAPLPLKLIAPPLILVPTIWIAHRHTDGGWDWRWGGK